MDNLSVLKGRYELKDALGHGGMGVVYRAYDRVLKCDVVVKTIRDAPEAAGLELFQRECEALVALNHPNIVPILDIGQFEEEGQSKPYFVMPLLPGRSLDRLIRDATVHLSPQRCVEIISQACRGLHAAHDRGLIHRDIKPGNIFVMPDFSVEIIDFGVAHMVSMGNTGQKGTLFYMAPELLQGTEPSVLSDIFALGVTAYELFTRRRPFERATERDVIEAILHEIPPPAKHLHLPIISRIKILSKLDIAEKRLPQDGGFTVRIEGRNIDLRISIMPTIYGEKVVMRILDKEGVALDLVKMGFLPQQLEAFKKSMYASYGL
ncbi:MAG: hypothetical protein EHM65_08700, partial [Acidobacteriales bacterium]